jgi:uncharacterized SAM-binding protein YcdF (DUF218 family)
MKPKSKARVIIYKFFSLILVVFSMSFSSRTCKRLLSKARQRPYEVGIVPGVPFSGDKWSIIMKARVWWAKYLHDEAVIRHVIFSGAAVHSPYVEGEVMRQYALAIGMSDEHISVEPLAEHSTENILYSYKLAKKKGFEKIALVSDPFQSKLLKRFTYRKVCPNIGMVPVVYDILNELENAQSDPCIDASGAYIRDFVPLKERENLQTRMKGTRGRKMRTDVYE